MDDRIKYHPGFVGGLGVLLWQYRDTIVIESEKWLSKEGIRMDVLVIKKDPEIIIDNDLAFSIGDTTYKRYVDSVFQVSFSANRTTYDLMVMEDENMCEALREFLKEDFEAVEAKAEKTGEIKGAIKLYYEEIGLTPQEIIKKTMERFSLDEKTSREYVENTLGLQTV